MQGKNLVLKEIADFPEPLIQEVLDFVRFLKTKAAQEKSEMAIMSESSLEKDWLLPEEDEAWQDL